MMRLTVVKAGILVFLMTSLGPAADQPKPNAVQVFMRVKLQSAQSVLQGLVTAKPELIVAGANQMLRMSKAAEWNVIKTPEYLQLSTQFRRNAESLAKAARDQNLDAARLAYMQLTLDCVECHKQVRGMRLGGPALPEIQRPFRTAQLGRLR